ISTLFEQFVYQFWSNGHVVVPFLSSSSSLACVDYLHKIFYTLRDKFIYDPKENSNASNTLKPLARSIQITSSDSQSSTPPSLWDLEDEKKA
ncbi:MAG: hypothetical protein M3Y81_24755, partial [Chloroflexota bacterium]|nr:hypothetical protein [Chloroflexota bacterium]